MKLFQVIIISISIFFITLSSNSDTNMPSPKWLEDERKSYVKYKFRYTQYMGFWLKKEEKNSHKSAVYYMLDNAQNGKIVAWYSSSRLVSGKVRVIQSYPISSGYCRMYQSYIRFKNKYDHMTNNACKLIGSNSWFFYK